MGKNKRQAQRAVGQYRGALLGDRRAPVGLRLELAEFVVKHSPTGACFMLIFPLRIFPFFHFHPILLLVSLFLYFLPTYLARNNSNFTAIFVLNLLTGWTFIGWIAALIWAISSEPKRQVAPPSQPVASAPPQPAAGGSFFCSNCGKPCVAGARFCSSCGAAQPATQR